MFRNIEDIIVDWFDANGFNTNTDGDWFVELGDRRLSLTELAFAVAERLTLRGKLGESENI